MLRFLPFCSVLALLLLTRVHPACGASSCPWDLNNDQRVTVDELLRAVDAALYGCPPESSPSTLVQTGQTECDQGTATLGPCPGVPLGQDGAVQAGVPLSYGDNGDGTIRDNATGLIWEKLSDNGDIHDQDTTYTWNDAFGVKIRALNTPPCFTGHCDWRLPNRRELESLVDAGQVAPAVDPVFNNDCMPGCPVTICSCTQLDNYWSSTTYQDAAAFAWAVDCNIGTMNGYAKSIAYYVRAVRGGS